ncbi:hypothetical protein [Pseudoponticoccus marisrubri]|uniref:Uncharacterized protein n=1 Tax=Pseudoponticoccus marisrubri TaxID=1685382 RepID=A0A0W7WPE6_9RHOB|nr:hypothetical protein [Pseudoponticoccus marisrubri]KUF12447.1 hypothetical protein AVJ23_01575 [Pseudoponticoccus marisrubri]
MSGSGPALAGLAALCIAGLVLRAPGAWAVPALDVVGALWGLGLWALYLRAGAERVLAVALLTGAVASLSGPLAAQLPADVRPLLLAAGGIAVLGLQAAAAERAGTLSQAVAVPLAVYCGLRLSGAWEGPEAALAAGAALGLVLLARLVRAQVLPAALAGTGLALGLVLVLS